MTRHEMLCEALRQLGRAINTTSTMRVVEVCHEDVPDATLEEIMEALNVVGGQEYMREADALELYGRMRGARITGVIGCGST